MAEPIAQINVLIVEDEQLFADRLEILVLKSGYRHVGTADNCATAITLFREHQPDLVLMDVNLNGEYDGIETAEYLNEIQSVPIIFITARTDDHTFRRAGRIGPENYLLKPFDDLQLRRTVALAVRNFTNREKLPPAPTEEDKALFIRVGDQLRKVTVANISHVEADGKYSIIYSEGQRHPARMSLQELADRLPTPPFFRTHRACLVNEQCVVSVNTKDSTILLAGGEELPLSRRQREEFLRRIEQL